MTGKAEEIAANPGTSAPVAPEPVLNPNPAPAPVPEASAAPSPAASGGAADVSLVHETPGLLETFDADKAAKESQGAAAAAAKPADAPVEKSEPAAAKADDKPVTAEVKPEAKADKPAAEADKPKAETDKPAEAKPAEPKLEDKLAALAKYLEPVDYKFELPESIKPDDPKLKEFTELLGAGEVKIPAEIGQKLIGFYADATRAYAEQLVKDQHKAFLDTRKAWATEAKADPVIGGAGFQTAMGAVARARDTLVAEALGTTIGSKAFDAGMKDFYEMGRVTGVTDHPFFLKILHAAARYLDEPQGDRMPADIRPPASNGKPPKGGSLYKHPSSESMNRI